MSDWLWENLPKLLGVAGFLLAAFNQWSIWRDRSERKAAAAPRGRLKSVDMQPSGETTLAVIFTNTRHCRLLLTEARIVSPKGYGLVMSHQSAEGMPAEPRRSVTISWSVMAADEHEGRSQGRFHAAPLPGSSAGGSRTEGEAIRWEIVFKGEEISTKRRAVTIAVTKIAKVTPISATDDHRSRIRPDSWLGIRDTDWFSRE